MSRKVVVATDLAEDSERALDWTLKNVYKQGDQFHIVHVAKLKASSPFRVTAAGPLRVINA